MSHVPGTRLITRISPSYLDKNVGHWPLGSTWRGRPGCPDRGSPRGNSRVRVRPDRGSPRGNSRGRVRLGSEGMMPSTGTCRKTFSCCRVKPRSKGPCRKRVVVVPPGKTLPPVDVDRSITVLVVMVLTWGAVFKKSVGVSPGIWPHTSAFKYKSVTLKIEDFELKTMYL